MNELPPGWTEAPLEALVEILDTARVPVNAKERDQRIAGKLPQALFPYYGATGQVGEIDNFIFDEPLILLGEDGVPFLDRLRHKAYMVDGRCWVNNHAHVLRAIDAAADRRYLAGFLNVFDYNGFVTGSTRLKLTQAAMRSIPVPLAPLREQKRIADKVEVLLARVDACRERLDRVPAILKHFRRAVLAAATSGELTRAWRELHSPQLSGSSLLEAVREEHRLHYFAGQAGRKTSSRRSVVSTSVAGAKFNHAGAISLPVGWAWATGADVVEPGAEIIYGIIQPGPKLDDGVPYIRGMDIERGRIIVDQLMKTSAEIAQRYSRSSLKAGDVVLGIIRATKVAVIPEALEGANITQGTARFRAEADRGARSTARGSESISTSTHAHRDGARRDYGGRTGVCDCATHADAHLQSGAERSIGISGVAVGIREER